MTKVVEALNIDIPKIRSNFHLYNKVEELAGEVGWKTVVKWEQGTVFPIIVTERLKFYATRLVNDC
jgi:DNA-binding transcriptional regulator YiaG